MLETDETTVTALRIIGFLLLFVGVYPSIILTPMFIISSIVSHSPSFSLAFLRLLIVFYVSSALGYYFVVKARNLEKRGAKN